MKFGIVGLPKSGKTTVLAALTGAHGETDPGSSRGPGPGQPGKPDVHVATVKVPDERVDFLAGLFKPKKAMLASIDFLDIPGIGAGRSQKDSVQSLAALREADALLCVLRLFDDPAVPHPHGDLGPARDAREVLSELALADLAIIEKRIRKIDQSVAKPAAEVELERKEKAALERCRAAIEHDGAIAELDLGEEERRLLRNFQFLTEKPVLTLLNVGEDAVNSHDVQALLQEAGGEDALAMCGKLEMEIAELPEEDQAEFAEAMGLGEPGSARVIRACYRKLGLISFFTVVSDDLRAWTLHEGDTALTAAGKIHTDIARGFIRAEVVSFDDLKQHGDMKAARSAGKARLEGKEYAVRDGDVITFRFKV